MTVTELTKQEIADMIRPSGWIDPKKFYAVMISSAEFCRIHAISYPTLIRWIEQAQGQYRIVKTWNEALELWNEIKSRYGL